MEKVDKAVFSFSHFEMRLLFDEMEMNESCELYRSLISMALTTFQPGVSFAVDFLAPCRSQTQLLRSIKIGVSM
jgi:hypothetical protein